MGKHGKRKSKFRYDPWEEALKSAERRGEIEWKPDRGLFESTASAPAQLHEPVTDVSETTLVGPMQYEVTIRINCIDGDVTLNRTEQSNGPHEARDAAEDFIRTQFPDVPYDVLLIARNEKHWLEYAVPTQTKRSISGIPLT